MNEKLLAKIDLLDRDGNVLAYPGYMQQTVMMTYTVESYTPSMRYEFNAVNAQDIWFGMCEQGRHVATAFRAEFDEKVWTGDLVVPLEIGPGITPMFAKRHLNVGLFGRKLAA